MKKQEKDMQRIAKFHKVSEQRFIEDWDNTFPGYGTEDIRQIYRSITVPKRATAGSAGYDFHCIGSGLFDKGSHRHTCRNGE